MPILRRDAQDSLTGLLDREAFIRRADHMAEKHPDESLTLTFFRIQNMKAFNVRQGIRAGDDVLRIMADQLHRSFPKGFAARYAVDSFLAIVQNDGLHDVIVQLNQDLPNYGAPDGMIVKAGYVC